MGAWNGRFYTVPRIFDLTEKKKKGPRIERQKSIAKTSERRRHEPYGLNDADN